jgi:hypothetical protein
LFPARATPLLLPIFCTCCPPSLRAIALLGSQFFAPAVPSLPL